MSELTLLLQVLAMALEAHQPLLEQDIPKRQDFVEILDSSDEEDASSADKTKGKVNDHSTIVTFDYH